jgi:CheY-like chemotaxis protein
MERTVLTATDSARLPDLIVTDLSMPHMTGLELVRAVKSDARMRNIPVAIITSSDTPSDRDVAISAGACSFVAKPFGVDALTRALIGIREACVEVTSAASV